MVSKPTDKRRAGLQDKMNDYLARKAAKTPTPEQMAKRQRLLDVLAKATSTKPPSDSKK